MYKSEASSSHKEYNFDEDGGAEVNIFQVNKSIKVSSYEDENAIDSSMFKKSNASGALGGNRNEPLIWKPVFNAGNTSSSTSPHHFADTPKKQQSAAVAASAATPPPPLSTFTTKPVEVEAVKFKHIVDYSSNSNESSSSNPPTHPKPTLVEEK